MTTDKLVYVKRWRTIVKLPAKYADEIVEALTSTERAPRAETVPLHDANWEAQTGNPSLCSDCPPLGDEYDGTRCTPCPRRR